MRRLLECEVEFWNEFGIGLLEDCHLTCIIEDGKITELDIPDFQESGKELLATLY